jgi:hypothetical protein
VVVLRRIADHTGAHVAELRAVRETAGPPVPGPAGFGLLAAEFGLRQFEAVHGWAQWAIEQLERYGEDAPPGRQPASTTLPSSAGEASSGCAGSTRTV